MNNFENDVEEIIEFVHAYPFPEEIVFPIVALDNITEKTDDTYLNDRATFVREKFDSDDGFKYILSKPACLCIKGKCSNCPINKYCNHFINGERIKAQAQNLKMIDLFCGAGGLSVGFTSMGFHTVLANDIQECCIDTYAHNHPGTLRKNIICGPIQDLVKDLNVILENQNVDVVVGGPPCQGFSMANRQRMMDDPRNKLYQSFVEVVCRVNPSFFVMENVKGMLSVVNEVKDDFNNIGYSVSAHILNACDFGVPQNRERLIFIGNRIGADNEEIFRKIIDYGKHQRKTVLEDALYGLKPLTALKQKNSTHLGTNESGRRIDSVYMGGLSNAYIRRINNHKNIKIVCNHKARYNNERDIEIFRRLNPGDRSDDPKIADIMPYKRRNNIFKDKYYKLIPNRICKTITAHMKFDCNMYIHPKQARGLTPREAARVQSYPDDYYFRGSYTKTYMQIGNSVPPLLGRAIARILIPYIEEGKK